MEIEQAKANVMQLMKDKDKLEAELQGLQAVLETVCIT